MERLRHSITSQIREGEDNGRRKDMNEQRGNSAQGAVEGEASCRLMLFTWGRKLYPEPTRERGKNGFGCTEIGR